MNKDHRIQKQAALFEGRDRWHIEDVTFSDGPHGLRIETEDSLGFAASKPANVFPAASCVSSSFDEDLLYEYGERIGEECVKEDVDVLLGPGVNHKRSPLCGRNFEYYSEDPYLTAVLASAYIRGVQSKGVGTSLKHFAANSKERGRMVSNSIIDERTLHELYLKQFEYIVKNAKPYTIMNAYNLINGTYCCENRELMDEARSWGFDGVFVSDWGGVADPLKSINAGLNLEMPGVNRADLILLKGLENGTLKEETLARSTEYLEHLFAQCAKEKKNSFSQDQQEAFIEKAAEESIVLLKNRNVLPLDRTMHIALFGEGMVDPVIQGGGSSRVNGMNCDCFTDVLEENHIAYQYYDADALKDAGKLHEIRTAERILVCADLAETYFRETSDREDLSLSEETDRLITELAEINENIIVIVQTGGPVLLPWRHLVKGIVYTGFGGSRSSHALYRVLYGMVSASGKLSETWPLRERDVPCVNDFTKDLRRLEYREGIYSGYRYYDTFHVPVLYPFGYGLSYTTFTYSDLSVERYEDEIVVSLKVKNTGAYDGRCVVQLYRGMKDSRIARAAKELIAFRSIDLKQNEEKTIKIVLNTQAFAYYDVRKKQWLVEDGTYQLYVCRSVSDIVEMKEVHLDGVKDPYSSLSRSFIQISENGVYVSDEDFMTMLEHEIVYEKNHEITVNTTLKDLSKTKLGFIVNRLVEFAMKFINTNGVAEESVFEGPIRQILWADDDIVWDTLYEMVDIMNHPTPLRMAKFINQLRTDKKNNTRNQ